MNSPYQSAAREETLRQDARSNEQFRSIWETALSEYKSQTGHDLAALNIPHQTSDLSSALQQTELSFKRKREGHEGYQKARSILKSCVMPLKIVSGIATSALSLTPFAPAATLFGAGMFLIEACDNVSDAYDFVAELLQSCTTYVERLETLSEMEMHRDIVVRLTIVLKYILEVFADCEGVMKSGRFKNWMDKVVRGQEKDKILKGSLQKLERYFSQEQMATVARVYVQGEKTFLNSEKLVDFGEVNKVQRVIDSLSCDPLDVVTRQAEYNAKSSVLPPVWIEEHEAFREWIEETSPQQPWLWVMGNVGVGKTTLVSYIAKRIGRLETSLLRKDIRPHLVNAGLNDQSSQYSLPRSAVALFYGNYDIKGEQSPDYVFQCLIRQLLQQLQVAAIDRADRRCDQIKDLMSGTEAASYLSWTSILNDIASEFQWTYIFVDALDKEEAGYEDLIARLFQLRSPSVKLFVTSRDDQAMQNDADFRKARSLLIRTDPNLIISYVRNRLERIRDQAEIIEGIGTSALPKVLKDSDEFEKVVGEVMVTAQGNFYYAEESINLLLQERDSDKLRCKMTKLIEGLSEVIRLDVERVEQQSDQYNRRVGLAAIMFTAFSAKRLSVDEIQHAVALLVHPESVESPRQLSSLVRSFTINYLVECSCRSLRVDDQKGTVEIGKEIKTYCKLSEKFKSAHYEIAKMCLNFLDRMSFSLRCTSQEDLVSRRKQYPFYPYAARYWALHMKAAGESLFFKASSPVPLSTLLSRRLFCNAVATELHEDFHHRVWNWAGNDTWKSLQDFGEPVVPGVHLLVHLDLHRTLDWWLRKNPQGVHTKGATGMTPLYWACLLGRVRMVEILLFDYHADATVMGSPPSGYCLAAAVSSQSPETVERILYMNHKETLQLGNWHGRRPLGEAVRYDNVDIVRMLIDATLALPDGEEQLLMGERDGWTALHEIAAAPRSLIEAMDMLVGTKCGKAFLTKRTKRWEDSALHLAAIRGNHEAVKHLLRLGADPYMRQRSGHTPLMLAVAGLYENNEETIRLLLDVMKDHEIRDKEGRTSWHIAARTGRNRNLKLLVEHTPKLLFNAKDNHGETAIRSAAVVRQGGWAHCIRVLLRDCPGQTGLEDAYAVLNALIPDGREVSIKAMQLLIEQHPVESWPYCRGQTTLLHKILHHGSLESMEMAWAQLREESGNILEYHDAGGSTPLILAAAVSLPIEVATKKAIFLIKKGANVNARDNGGRTALHHAVRRDLPELAAALLSKGADFRIKDNDGTSPLDLIPKEEKWVQIPEVLTAKYSLAQEN